MAEAKTQEGSGDLRAALERWNQALALLPGDASQTGWVRKQVLRLELEQKLAPAEDQGGRVLALFSPKFLLSLAAFVGLASLTFGFAFGVGFAAQILIHEMGHYIDIRRRGLPADMPVFLPGLGAYVRWRAMGVSDRTRAEISLAGPLAGFFAATACAAMWWHTREDNWATLAHVGAMLNLLNLVPVWALDGGQAIVALDKAGRWTLLIVCIALWPLLGQPVFFLVAGGIAYRLFMKDPATEPCPSVTAYFAAVLALLGAVLWFLSKHGAAV